MKLATESPETVEDLRALFTPPDASTPEPEPAEPAEPSEPHEDEPAGDPEAEPEVEGDAEPLLAGKYKDVAALEAAYLEAQAALGRQGSELGNLRKLEAEMQQIREGLAQPQQPTYDPGSLDAYLAENPQQIPAFAEQAIATGDGYAYQRALAAWSEYDQMGAMDYHARKVSEANTAQLEARLQPALQGMQRQQTTSEMATAYETMASKHPDFNTVMNGVSQETLDGFPPEVLTALQTGDQASKERVLETLYRWTKAEQAGTLTQAATAAVQQAAQDSRAAKQDAAVATPTGSLDREPVVLSPVDQYRQAFRESAEFKRATGELNR